MSAGWAGSLEATWDMAWRCLEAGVGDADRAARLPALATVGPDGPEARTVVLREADRAAATLQVHTDLLSAKVGEIARDPRAALLVWDAQASLQLRLRVHVTVLHGQPADAAWFDVPDFSRINYGGQPPPGRALDAPSAYAPTVERARFAVLHCHLQALETLHLGRDLHSRARFTAPDFRGGWIAP